MRERPELVKILRDKQLSINTILQKEGYRIRLPRAEWSVFRSSIIITNEDGSIKEISDHKLKDILEGRENLAQDELKLLNEWYQVSAYRFGYEIDKLEKQIKLAKKSENESTVSELKNRLNSLLYERNSLSEEELRKKQFSYYYNEKGERLEGLYEILIGKYEYLRFGVIRVSVSSNAYLDEMLEEGYGVSKGFFEDLCIAYDFIQKVTGPLKFSPSGRLTYTDEYISGEGNGFLDLDRKSIGLKSKIEKEGLKERFECSVKTSELNLDLNETLKTVNLYLPNYFLDKDESCLVGYHEEKTMGLFYSSSKGFFENILIFKGNPYILKEEIPKFLKVILNN